MRAIFETLFDIVYLVTVITIGIRMIRGSKGNRQFQLFGWMAVVLVPAIPSTWSLARWRSARRALTLMPCSWVWASGLPRLP